MVSGRCKLSSLINLYLAPILVICTACLTIGYCTQTIVHTRTGNLLIRPFVMQYTCIYGLFQGVCKGKRACGIKSRFYGAKRTTATGKGTYWICRLDLPSWYVKILLILCLHKIPENVRMFLKTRHPCVSGPTNMARHIS